MIILLEDFDFFRSITLAFSQYFVLEEQVGRDNFKAFMNELSGLV
jgi:hypothetical protein